MGTRTIRTFLKKKKAAPTHALSPKKTACDPNPCLNGSVCSPSADGRNFTCNCTSPAYFGRYCQGRICANFDFEEGNLTGWIQEGTAFKNQPTYGDNSDARGKPSKLHGNWYIGTFENRPSPLYPVGGQQGDVPTGKLTSPSFVIQGPTLKFLIGGGARNTNFQRAELLIGGIVVVNETTSTGNEEMIEKNWNVSELIGKTARLRVVDDGDGKWGHINFDYFRDETCAGP
ncbi:predicted protein [Nematostella vectensis]|uniref:EGF-like domain-containing protein n=1 Tax=Nematostella vectensis TaxID=45351 RepID=A7RST6_NEMVE|nr:predicted protein [Nematostella vectensis]|eukprot:XP_001637534.1 predicted protein [Nematostella vectensis]